jgi:hypothetical protein
MYEESIRILPLQAPLPGNREHMDSNRFPQYACRYAGTKVFRHGQQGCIRYDFFLPIQTLLHTLGPFSIGIYRLLLRMDKQAYIQDSSSHQCHLQHA